ncbi:MAG: hypothetical protein ACHQ53_06185 [Polyangiales bacterium]
MANVEKLSITLSKDDLQWARKRARNRGVSLSALLSEIVARRRRQEAWSEWIKRAVDEPFTAEELEAARRELDGSSSYEAERKKRRKAG